MKFKLRKIMALFAAIMCIAAFSVTAFASDGGGCYASDENGDAKPSGPITNIMVSTEDVTVPEKQESKPLTPPGNLTLVDDILQNNAYVSEESNMDNKQFLTVQSKNGNTFYLVIDRSGNTENVYFLNLVDEADLMALIEEGGTVKPPVCTCKDKCTPGHVDHTCPICKQNPSECCGHEAPVEEQKPIEPPSEQQTTPEPPKSSSMGTAVIALVLIMALAGGGAFYWFKFRKSKPGTKGTSDLDNYDYGEDEEEQDEDYEFEDEQVDSDK